MTPLSHAAPRGVGAHALPFAKAGRSYLHGEMWPALLILSLMTVFFFLLPAPRSAPIFTAFQQETNKRPTGLCSLWRGRSQGCSADLYLWSFSSRGGCRSPISKPWWMQQRLQGGTWRGEVEEDDGHTPRWENTAGKSRASPPTHGRPRQGHSPRVSPVELRAGGATLLLFPAEVLSWVKPSCANTPHSSENWTCLTPHPVVPWPPCLAPAVLPLQGARRGGHAR